MRIPIVPTLGAASLALALAQPAMALSVSDSDSLTMNFGIDVQAREEAADAQAQGGGHYDIINGRPGNSDEMNTQERRARLFLYGTYDTDWRYFVGYLADNADNTYYKNTNRAVQLFKGYVERDLHSGALTSTFHAGVDYPFYNIAIQGDPNWLFCNQRATGTLGNIRGLGLRYKLGGSMFTWGFDIMKNMDPAAKPGDSATDPGGAYERDGLFYSSRLEISVLGPKPAYKESWAGAPGHSLLLAADVGYDDHDLGLYNGTPANQFYATNSLGYGVEGLYHHDGLDALAECRWLNTHANNVYTGPSQEAISRIWLIQAGYTFPVDGIGVEPALRFTQIRYDEGHDIAENYDSSTAGPLGTGTSNGIFGIGTAPGDPENGLSGRQVDAGVNLFFVKHVFEMQIDYSYWKADTGDAHANIVRVQEQVAF